MDRAWLPFVWLLQLNEADCGGVEMVDMAVLGVGMEQLSEGAPDLDEDVGEVTPETASEDAVAAVVEETAAI